MMVHSASLMRCGQPIKRASVAMKRIQMLRAKWYHQTVESIFEKVFAYSYEPPEYYVHYACKSGRLVYLYVVQAYPALMDPWSGWTEPDKTFQTVEWGTMHGTHHPGLSLSAPRALESGADALLYVHSISRQNRISLPVLAGGDADGLILMFLATERGKPVSYYSLLAKLTTRYTKNV